MERGVVIVSEPSVVGKEAVNLSLIEAALLGEGASIAISST